MSEQGQRDNALAFRAMADRIDLNKDHGFSGAFVTVPPDGNTIELLLLNNKPDSVMFWTLVKTRAEIAIAELQDAERSSHVGLGRR